MGAAEQIWVHRFEQAGLGKAPFKVVGFSVEKFQAIPGDPSCPIQPGSSCDYCGQGIMNVYRLESADGKFFKVGCDCVARTGDTALTEATRLAERAYRREKREAGWRAEQAAKELSRREREARQAAENLIEYELLLAVCDQIVASESVGEYEKKTATWIAQELRNGRRDHGPWSQEITTLSRAWRAAIAPPSKPFGTKGDRVRNLVATYEGGPVFETQYGTKRLANFRLDTGEILVWSTTAPIGRDVPSRFGGMDWAPFQEGDRVRIVAATIDKHGEWKGTSQTFVKRAKIVEA